MTDKFDNDLVYRPQALILEFSSLKSNCKKLVFKLIDN